MEDDAVVELPAARPHDLVELRKPEWHEEEAGLVDVPVVLVDDVDLRLVGVEAAAQPVSHHRAAGAAAEDHDLPPAHGGHPTRSAARPPTPRLIVSSNSNPASIERRSGQAAATFCNLATCSSVSSPLSATATVEPPRRRAVVVVDVDRDLAEIPAFCACVPGERGRDAGGERGGEELMRCWPAVLTAEAFRLVGDEPMAAVDHDFLTQRAGNRLGGCSQTHRAYLFIALPPAWRSLALGSSGTSRVRLRTSTRCHSCPRQGVTIAFLRIEHFPELIERISSDRVRAARRKPEPGR